jgi:hypothetical protein
MEKTSTNLWLPILIIILLGMTMQPSIAQTNDKTPSLKILAWNIYMLPSIVPLPSRAKRAKKIIDTLTQ